MINLQSNMESLYAWFPLVSFGIFIVGVVIGFVVRGVTDRKK